MRQALSRQITLQYTNQHEPLKVITAGASLEKKFAESVHRSEQGSYLSIDPETSQTIFQKIQEQASQLQQSGADREKNDATNYCSCSAPFIERFAPDLPVLSYNELEPEIEIQSVGVINISAGASKIPVGAVNI